MTDLRVDGVCKGRGGAEVLRGVDLALRGGILALLGPSGCGKTTLLRLLAGFDRCDAGTIVLADRTVDGPSGHVPPEKRGIGYVPQEGLLFPHLTVAGNIGFGLTRAERRNGRISETLRLVGLDDVEDVAERQPHQLSGGQQQRVALARALAPQPRLVLLDEPFNGLDGALRRTVAAETASVLRTAGATAVLVTHNPQEAFAVADRIAVMHGGRIIQEASPKTLYQRSVTLEVARLIGPTLEMPGEVRNGAAQTPLGLIAVVGPDACARDGGAIILLRPEQVRRATPGEGRLARVQATSFSGGHTRIAADLDGSPLELRFAGMVDPPDQLWVAVEGTGLAFPA